MTYFWILVVALLACKSSFGELSPRVSTSLGDLQGTARQTSKGRTYFAFEGVPYAVPPIGSLRFKEPVPVTPWSGLLNATRLPNICVQGIYPATPPGSYVNVIGSEDCLYLNIYTPKLPHDLPDGKLFDVVFYIAGGAFRAGFGHMNGPEYIMDRNIVLINFNYRLGVLGFFSLEDELSPGNYGLKDQLLALKWVNKHIASFGGNPNKITIFGSSAGGASVHCHLLSPQSKGLFQKAVANSGSVLNPWVLTRNARTKSLDIANAVGCSGNRSGDILDCLRERPADRLAREIGHSMYLGKYIPIHILGPIVEKPSPNAFLSQRPIDIIKSKSINDVPTMFSYTSTEGSVIGLYSFVDVADAQAVENEWDTLAPQMFDFEEVIVDPAKRKEISQLIRQHYLGKKKVAEALPEFMQIFTDRHFVNGIQEAAILHAENQVSPVHSYKFSYTNPQIPSSDNSNVSYKAGAGHASDIPYVLKSPSRRPSMDLRSIPEAAEMSDTMIDYYMSFINETQVPGWEPVNSELPNIKYLEITSPRSSQNVFRTEKPRGEFWNTLGIYEN